MGGSGIGISVVVTTYKEPEHLRLCVSSALENADMPSRVEVVVSIDGTVAENKAVIDEYAKSSNVKFIASQKNVGMCHAQNTGVSACSNGCVVICNDDHVFPPHWDTNAEKTYSTDTVTSFLTIERRPSAAKYVICRDYGSSPSDFDMHGFRSDNSAVEFDESDRGYAIYPFMMNKWKYLSIGGFDERYPNGVVADFELFLKAKIMGMRFATCFENRFYHFGSTSANDSVLNGEGRLNRTASDYYGHEYAKSKWGRDIRSVNCKAVLFSHDDGEEFKALGL